MLCELTFNKIRIYYTLIQGKTIINEIEYLGKLEVKDASTSHKNGSKKNYSKQQKDINKMKKDF
jgi:1,2-phenylacetyl-CoA epoxidase catalytic subunit